MAGHSKWSKVQRNKGLLDQKRGKLFRALASEITDAAPLGGRDGSRNLPRTAGVTRTKGNELASIIG